MTTNNEHAETLRMQIKKGLELTFEKLLKKKKAENGSFAFSENGKIKIVKASEVESLIK